MGLLNLAFKNLYLNYKRHARNRGYPFKLTHEQFHELCTTNCFYCDRPPLQNRKYARIYKRTDGTKRRYEDTFLYNGIDRLDNTKGYFVENCVPCCGDCNKMKMQLSFPEFIKQIRRVYEKAVQCSWFGSPSNPEESPRKQRRRGV